ncbi:hypothetical protein Tco_1020975 [Tanacetum coccineum]
MYDGERLHSTKIIIDSPDSNKTLEDAEESRLRMKNKIIQLNYAKLNALYETFVPQKFFSAEQTYFSTPASNVSSESSKEILDLPTSKMPNESKLLKMFDEMDEAILALQKNIDCETTEFDRLSIKRTLLKAKTVNDVNDGSNLVCVSCSKDVFMISHEKCVARYALSADSRVKRALSTSPVAAKSSNLGATSVVAKSSLFDGEMILSIHLLIFFLPVLEELKPDLMVKSSVSLILSE